MNDKLSASINCDFISHSMSDAIVAGLSDATAVPAKSRPRDVASRRTGAPSKAKGNTKAPPDKAGLSSPQKRCDAQLFTGKAEGYRSGRTTYTWCGSVGPLAPSHLCCTAAFRSFLTLTGSTP